MVQLVPGMHKEVSTVPINILGICRNLTIALFHKLQTPTSNYHHTCHHLQVGNFTLHLQKQHFFRLWHKKRLVIAKCFQITQILGIYLVQHQVGNAAVVELDLLDHLDYQVMMEGQVPDEFKSSLHSFEMFS